MPSYYRKSKVMHQITASLESEYERLKNAVTLTENQFFVLLSDTNISKHEKDVGLAPDVLADLETRRGRILAKLRGTGTVTKAMIKNVASSFEGGDILITEYQSRYLFSVTFNSKQGVPYNLEDIKAVINDIKPAHLAVEYIFTYRLWQDVKDSLENWTEVKSYTWEYLMTFEVKNHLNIACGLPYFCPDAIGNAQVIWAENKAYAREVSQNG